MEDNSPQYRSVLKTGKIYELDMAINLLKEKNIPHFKRQETSAGVQFAMPFLPTQGSGIWYAIYVLEEVEKDAKKILSELPFDLTQCPDIWDFAPQPKVKKGFRIFARIILFSSALYMLVKIIILLIQT